MDSLRDDSRIDSDLAAVDASMGKVPSDRREALLLELREHVDKLVEDYEAAGRSKADAVDGALSMMGVAKKVGRQYARMWYRSTEPGSILAAIGVITIVSTCVTALQNPFVVRANLLHHSMLIMSIVVAMALIRSCAGVFAGWITPRGAVAGVAIHAVVYIASISTMLLAPHVTFGISAGYVMGAEVLGIPIAALSCRLRMRKFAGI